MNDRHYALEDPVTAERIEAALSWLADLHRRFKRLDLDTLTPADRTRIASGTLSAIMVAEGKVHKCVADFCAAWKVGDAIPRGFVADGEGIRRVE